MEIWGRDDNFEDISVGLHVTANYARYQLNRLIETLSTLETESSMTTEHQSALQQLGYIFHQVSSLDDFLFHYMISNRQRLYEARNGLEHYRRAGRNDICALLDILITCLDKGDTKQLKMAAKDTIKQKL